MNRFSGQEASGSVDENLRDSQATDFTTLKTQWPNTTAASNAKQYSESEYNQTHFDCENLVFNLPPTAQK